MEFRHELIIPNDDLNFKMFVFEGKDGNYAVDKHWHRSVEIFAVFQGRIGFSINAEQRYLEPGDFMLVNSNEIHSIQAPERNLTVVLQIPLQVFENYYTEHGFILFTHYKRSKDTQLMELIHGMYSNYISKNFGYEMRVQSQFYMLLYLLVIEYRETEVSSEKIDNSKKLNRLSIITSYLKDNYAKEISLEMLAHTFGYSPAYLSRMFQKYAMTNYKDYLQNVRVEYAYKELVNTDHSISDIALNNGFANSKSFSKKFREKYGVLPNAYRKNKKVKKVPSTSQ